MSGRSSERAGMVRQQIAARGVRDERVLDAMAEVPREEFVPDELREHAYDDTPLPIGHEQTISQPFIVASMIESLELGPRDRVLEIGAGSGYAAAVISRIAAEVVAIERHAALADEAAARLARLGYDNAVVEHGDGTLGWPEGAPFDAIVAAASGPDVPPALLEQLAVGGRLVIPVGDSPRHQRLVRLVRRADDEYEREELYPVRFVPLVGRQGWQDEAGRLRPGAGGETEKPGPARRGGPGAADAEATATDALVGLIDRHAEPFDDLDLDLDRLLGRVGDARGVLLGEASHGPSEFYRLRDAITRAMIRRKGFRFVAVEADWPDAARIDHWTRGLERPPQDWRAFARFPTWMWRNEEMRTFVDWLRAHNEGLAPEARAAFYGLDLYSLHTSVAAVLEYLADVDPETAKAARERYSCLEPFAGDPLAYGRAALTGRLDECADDIVANLQTLLDNRMRYLKDDGDRLLDAIQNARLVRDAERYYRVMYEGSRESWNLRDSHMFETLRMLLEHHGEDARAVVWAHNSHVGDARATTMGRAGEHNIGQLCRQEFGDDAYLVGFGTDHGTVAAAHEWGGDMEIMDVTPGRPDSIEGAGRRAAAGRFALPVGRRAAKAVREALSGPPLLERAIGVIYRPRQELMSHYFETELARQFDEWIHLDATAAVTPLDAERLGAVPETYPFGL